MAYSLEKKLNGQITVIFSSNAERKIVGVYDTEEQATKAVKLEEVTYKNK